MKSLLTILFVLSFIMLSSCLEGSKAEGKKEADNISAINNLAQEVKSDSISKNDLPEYTHKAEIKTSMGTIVIGLFGNQAPRTVENFVQLSKRMYFNGILFHRVAHGFVIQSGDGNTRFKSMKSEWGEGGESIYDGEFEDEIDSTNVIYRYGYREGIVGMANAGPNTNTSQFFICMKEAKRLKPKYTIFGNVISGMDVVEAIGAVDVEPSDRGDDDGCPKEPIKIFSVEVKELVK